MSRKIESCSRGDDAKLNATVSEYRRCALPNGHPPKIRGVEYDSQGFPERNLTTYQVKSVSELKSCLTVKK
ncbi:MAG: hypothetical protein LBI56_02155 [Puniceicoccales bacterium]|nr:hypothetical protein [Puniceicoccales bacterium]